MPYVHVRGSGQSEKKYFGQTGGGSMGLGMKRLRTSVGRNGSEIEDDKRYAASVTTLTSSWKECILLSSDESLVIVV